MASGNRGDIPILPDGIQLSYLAEGAANIIFRFSLDHPSAVDPNFPPNVDRTHLLRLRKSVASAVKSLPAYVALQNIFYPLFSKELILDTHVIRIPRGLIERENLVLKEQEASGNRPAKRAGLYLIGPPPSDITPDGELEQYEHYGFLVEDMTPAAPSEVGISRREVLVEFKPKWLLPSPTAPQGAKRCRTCALRALKVFQKRGVTIIGNGSPSPGYWCPFDLAGGEPQRVRRAVKSILSQKGTIKTGWKGGISEDERVILENKIVGYFIGPGTKLLGMLKQYQSDWDPRGPMNVFGENGDINTEPVVSGESNSGVWSDQWTEGVKKYLMAMTIRDFSFFLKASSCFMYSWKLSSNLYRWTSA